MLTVVDERAQTREGTLLVLGLIYVKNTDSAFAPRNPALCAFQRIHLKAGEKKKIRIPVSKEAFCVVDKNGDTRVDGPHFVFYAGCSQPDERSFELTGNRPVEISWTNRRTGS